jgi:four helix bundle protein
MAIYENLPVYKASYDLLLELYEVCKNLPRDHRFTIGERLKEKLMDMMVCIYHANSTTNESKAAHLKQAREYMVEIKLYIRLLHDMKQLSVRRFAVLTEKTESVSKQLTAWAKSVRSS